MRKILASVLLLAAGCYAQTPATITATLNGQNATVTLQVIPPTQLLVGSAVSNINDAPGKTASFDLSLSSTCSALRTAGCQQPSGLQFDISAPASSVTSFVVTEGPVATAAGKTFSCAPQTVTGQTVLRCILIGLSNATGIASGIVAHVAVTSPSTATLGTAQITFANFASTNGLGNTMQGSLGGGPTLTVVPFLAVSCAQLYVEPGEGVNCSVSLAPASSTALNVALSADKTGSPGLTVPASVTVAANATSGSFQVVGK